MTMEEIEQHWMEVITPQVPFEYRIRTTAGHETHSGFAWVADLLDPLGNVVGTVEQAGRGGMTEVYPNDVEQFRLFKDAVVRSYGKFDQEAATGWMQHLEDLAHDLQAGPK